MLSFCPLLHSLLCGLLSFFCFCSDARYFSETPFLSRPPSERATRECAGSLRRRCCEHPRENSHNGTRGHGIGFLARLGANGGRRKVLGCRDERGFGASMFEREREGIQNNWKGRGSCGDAGQEICIGGKTWRRRHSERGSEKKNRSSVAGNEGREKGGCRKLLRPGCGWKQRA